MHYYFEDSINTETVNNLVEKLEGQEEINLWFTTNGGEISAMKFLIDFLNSLEDKITVTLTDRLVSAGALLLTEYKGKLKIRDLDFMLFHKIDIEGYSLRKEYEPDHKILVKQCEEDNKIFAKNLEKIGLTKKQINKFNKGKDVVLYQKDFKRLKVNR